MGFFERKCLLPNIPGEQGSGGILLPNLRDPGGSFRECAGVSRTEFFGIFPGFSEFFLVYFRGFPVFFGN